MKKTDCINPAQIIALDLLTWGVSTEEALKTASAWAKSAVKRGILEWSYRQDAPNADPEGIISAALAGHSECSEDIVEEAVFYTYQKDISGLAHAVTHMPILHQRFQNNPRSFWMRLAKYVTQKRAGTEWVEKQPAWVIFAVEFWINSKRFPEPLSECPPVCLWTDGSIVEIFKDAPKSHSDVRVKLNRDCELHRPEGFAFRLVRGSWERCNREHYQKELHKKFKR